MNLRQQIEMFDKGEFDSKEHSVLCSAGWYDWFCSYASLQRRTKILYKKIKFISSSKKLDLDNMKATFKNCCPMVGPLYDIIWVTSLDDKVSFTIIPLDDNSKANLYANGTHILTGKWKDIKNWFLKD